MEGLFQILIIVFFVVASIFDAVSRGKKKQEQKERMEAEEAAGEAGAARPRPPRSSRPGTRTAEGRTARSKAPTGERTPGARPSARRGGEAGGAPTSTSAPSEGERVTADTMIPEDFWAILTGQAPNPRTGDADPPPRAEIPAPVPSDRMGGEVDTPPAPAETATRRSSRWMEGLEEEGARTGMGAPEAEEPVLAGTRARPTPPPPAGGTRSFPAPPPRPSSPFARREPQGASGHPMAEPWGALGDISSGEIGDGRGTTQGAVDLYGEDGSRRRAGASESPYVQLLASGRQADLKAAIVLREVLGTPVGSRGREDESRGWRWED